MLTLLLVLLSVTPLVASNCMLIAKQVHDTKAWRDDEGPALAFGCGLPILGLLSYCVGLTSFIVLCVRINQ